MADKWDTLLTPDQRHQVEREFDLMDQPPEYLTADERAYWDTLAAAWNRAVSALYQANAEAESRI